MVIKKNSKEKSKVPKILFSNLRKVYIVDNKK